MVSLKALYTSVYIFSYLVPVCLKFNFWCVVVYFLLVVVSFVVNTVKLISVSTK